MARRSEFKEQTTTYICAGHEHTKHVLGSIVLSFLRAETIRDLGITAKEWNSEISSAYALCIESEQPAIPPPRWETHFGIGPLSC